MAKAKKIPATKASRIAVGSNHYKLEPAVTRTHYGEHRQMSGGQPYAFPARRADEAWFVVSEWSGNRHGLVQQWNDGEWTFSKIEGSQQAPSWLRAYYRDTPATIYNLSSRLYSGTSPEEAIARGLGLSLGSTQASHATMKKKTPAQLDHEIAEVLASRGGRWEEDPFGGYRFVTIVDGVRFDTAGVDPAYYQDPRWRQRWESDLKREIDKLRAGKSTKLYKMDEAHYRLPGTV